MGDVTAWRPRLYTDGKYLAGHSLAGKENVYVVEIATRKVVFSGDLANNTCAVGLAFSPKGDRLYTVSTRGQFLVWDFAALIAPAKKK